MEINWDIIISLVTAFAALAALVLSNRQMKLSNKQHLFDKRLESYIIANGLLQLYRENSKIIDYKTDEPIFSIEMQFAWLTNNSYLERITPAINEPLYGESHKELLKKLESLKEVSTKIKFVFSAEESIILGDFVFCYQKLLFTMYQYNILLTKMKQVVEDEKISFKEAQKLVGEERIKIELETAFENLKCQEIQINRNKVEEKIKKQIML
ncbi:hypothetical protein BXY41_11617 [Lacrimispora xylanisolvens]|uniref:Uncharacterized protein n=1 Tax=Lacrimispora xylanisolvens TaxID=384636 RepID=A0A2S6HJ27_9FIRM|nr:hypothetical protein [Hungatella xylanolytica]PPK77479.1 hypothetical protein BXY41_11617 [Hungatella xylanolytica]